MIKTMPTTSMARKHSISVKRYIELFAKRKVNFYYSELETELLSKGYSIPAYIRPYILEHCKADKKDKMHFCHKDFLTDYPEVEWNCYKLKKKSRACLDWVKLENKLKEGLTKYKESWKSYGLDLEKSVKKFIGFLKGASNKNLYFCIPAQLYRYLQGNTSELEDMMFKLLLTTGYEGLLSEIIYLKTRIKHPITSLVQVCRKVCPEIIPVFTTQIDSLNGFDKIIRQLYNDRNTRAHGGYDKIENETIDIVALYVHTVAKYAA